MRWSAPRLLFLDYISQGHLHWNSHVFECEQWHASGGGVGGGYVPLPGLGHWRTLRATAAAFNGCLQMGGSVRTCKFLLPTWKTIWRSLQNLNISLSQHPALVLLGVFALRKLGNVLVGDIFLSGFIVCNNPNWWQTQCLSIGIPMSMQRRMEKAIDIHKG